MFADTRVKKTTLEVVEFVLVIDRCDLHKFGGAGVAHVEAAACKEGGFAAELCLTVVSVCADATDDTSDAPTIMGGVPAGTSTGLRW
jgi:hypothetical protein